MIDQTDRNILTLIQDRFPISARPYRVLGESLGLAEEEVLKRVRKLRREGLISRIGASFDSRKLGYVSTLVGMKVPRDRLEETAAVISDYPQVSHSYERENEYNLWFTLAASSAEELARLGEEIGKKTGITDILDLPAIRVFKIRVHFDLTSDCDGNNEEGQTTNVG